MTDWEPDMEGAPGIDLSIKVVGHPQNNTCVSLSPSQMLSEVRKMVTLSRCFHFVKKNRPLDPDEESSTPVVDVLPKLFTGKRPDSVHFVYQGVDYVKVAVRSEDRDVEVLCAAVLFILPDDYYSSSSAPGFSFIPSSYDIGLYSPLVEEGEENLFCCAALGLTESLHCFRHAPLTSYSPSHVPVDSRFRTPLHYASQNGHVDCCQELISSMGPDSVNMQDDRGFTALHLALQRKHVKTVACLINSKADLTNLTDIVNNKTALDLLERMSNKKVAILGQDVDFFKMSQEESVCLAKVLIPAAILEKDEAILKEVIPDEVMQECVNLPDELGWTVLHHAADRGHVSIVQCLLDRGADPGVECNQGRIPVNIAIRHGNPDLVKMLTTSKLPTQNIILAFEQAVKMKSVDVASSLLEIRPDLCSQESFKWLVINSLDQDYNRWHKILPHVEDSSGIIPNRLLPYAAYIGDAVTVARLLLKRETEVHNKDFLGNTPLHYACLQGHVDVVKAFLLDNPFQPNVTNWRGESPLHCACYSGHGDVACLLLDQTDVQCDLVDAMGRTALLTALHRSKIDLAEHLISRYGKKLNISAVDNEGYSAQHYSFLLSDETVSKILLFSEDTNSLPQYPLTPARVRLFRAAQKTWNTPQDEDRPFIGLSSPFRKLRESSAFRYLPNVICPGCHDKINRHRRCQGSVQAHLQKNAFCRTKLSSDTVDHLKMLCETPDIELVISHNKETLSTLKPVKKSLPLFQQTVKIKRMKCFQCSHCCRFDLKFYNLCPRCSSQTFHEMRMKPFQFHLHQKPEIPPSPLQLAVIANKKSTVQALCYNSQITGHQLKRSLELSVSLLHTDLMTSLLQVSLTKHLADEDRLDHMSLVRLCMLAHNWDKPDEEETHRLQLLKGLLECGFNYNSGQSLDEVNQLSHHDVSRKADQAVRIWKKLHENGILELKDVQLLSPLAVGILLGRRKCVNVLLRQSVKSFDVEALTIAALQGDPESMEGLLKSTPQLPVEICQIFLAYTCETSKRNLMTIKALIVHCPSLLAQTHVRTFYLKKIQVKFAGQTHEVIDVSNLTLLEQLMESTLFCSAYGQPRGWGAYQEARATIEDFGHWLIESGLHLGEVVVADDETSVVVHAMCAALPTALKGKYWRIAKTLLSHGGGETVWKCGCSFPPSACQLALGLSLEELVHLAADREAPDEILGSLVASGCKLLRNNVLGSGRNSVDATILYWTLGGKEDLVSQLDSDCLVYPFSECNPVDRAILMAMSNVLMSGSDLILNNAPRKKKKVPTATLR